MLQTDSSDHCGHSLRGFTKTNIDTVDEALMRQGGESRDGKVQLLRMTLEKTSDISEVVTRRTRLVWMYRVTIMK